MSALYEMIHLGDLVGLLGIIAVLGFVGNKMIQNDAESAILSTRIAGGTFVLYFVYRIIFEAPASSSAWFLTAFSALLASVVALTFCWVFLPTLRFAISRLLSPGWKKLQTWYISRDREMSTLRDDLQKGVAENQRLSSQLQDQHYEQVVATDQRERKYQLEQSALANQQQCEEIRLECDLFYQRYHQDIAKRLPEQIYERLMSGYVKPINNPEVAKKRAAMIKSMIRRYVQQAKEELNAQGNRKQFKTLKELAFYFEAQRQEIEALPFDQETKESWLIALNAAQDEASEAFYANQ